MELIPLILILVLLWALFKWCSHQWISPESKGKIGEHSIAKYLISHLTSEYIILNDLYLPLPNKTTTQIDHVVVSPYGIFVIESKNYSGWIFASATNRYWTQILYRTQSRFQNPIRQNYHHINTLSKLLRLHKQYFHNIIVFNDKCEFKTAIPFGVFYQSSLIHHITSFEEIIFTNVQVEQIVNAIIAWQSTITDSDKKMHTFHLYQNHNAAITTDTPPSCPYCGSPMILRQRHDGSGKFYGCKAYPKCRGIINIR